MSDMNRRNFLVTAATTAAVLSLPVLQEGNLAFAEKAGAATQPAGGAGVDVGPLKSFDKDGVTDTWAAKTKAGLLIIRKDGKLYASSSICTHKGCVVQKRAEDLYCKCHKSVFTFQGNATAGPAQRSGSLPRYAISVNADGHVMVDKTKQFTDKDWDNPASFVKIESAV
jgi:nitrite reductase/ring-hydroxylating ferredoxin subunit